MNYIELFTLILTLIVVASSIVFSMLSYKRKKSLKAYNLKRDTKIENPHSKFIDDSSIRSLLYLDENKMYSISSQIFEGLTEYIISYDKEVKLDFENQYGEIASGKLMANILTEGKEKQEKKFLHDFSYILFENELKKRNKVIEINKNSIPTEDDLSNYTFVKVKGKATLIDSISIQNLLQNFNKYGEAITYAQMFSTGEFGNLGKAREYAKKNSLYFDEKLLNHLKLLLDFGYKDSLEINIILNEHESNEMFFSSPLNRTFLKEKEDFLIKKYSRRTERELIIFGIITQSKKPIIIEEKDKTNPPKSMKEGLLNMVFALSNMEDTYTGARENEIIIDPISVYVEV